MRKMKKRELGGTDPEDLLEGERAVRKSEFGKDILTVTLSPSSDHTQTALNSCFHCRILCGSFLERCVPNGQS